MCEVRENGWIILLLGESCDCEWGPRQQSWMNMTPITNIAATVLDSTEIEGEGMIDGEAIHAGADR